MSQVFKNTFFGLLSLFCLTSVQAAAEEEKKHSRPSKQKIDRGDRVAIQEAPSVSLHQFKMEDREHNHEDYVRNYKGQKLHTHTDFAAFHLNTAYRFLSQENMPDLLFELQMITTVFHAFNNVSVTSDKSEDFMKDVTTKELQSDLYTLSPWAYHLMRSADHLYRKRRITLVNQKYYSYPPEESRAMINSLNRNHELCAEIWNFLKASLSTDEYQAYQKRQAELSTEFRAYFKP